MENLVSLDQLSSFYHNKKVFVTGHSGFKGSWLTAVLHLAGARVKGYSLAPEYRNGLLDSLQAMNAVESVLADIRDMERLRKELQDFQPDYIFHLAAQPLVRRSYLLPAETFDVNVTGTANLLECANGLKGQCTVVVVTTDKVYENREKDILYSEDDRLGGYDPYSASKACAEIAVDSFRNSFFSPSSHSVHKKAIASARAGNVIGGGDWSEDRIIPDIIRALQSQKTISVRNPHAVRPWQHVLEPLSGYLLLGALLNEHPEAYSQAYNFGPLPDDHLTVEQLVRQAISHWGEGDWCDESKPGQLHEAGLLKLDISRARKELNWHPRLDAATAISWTLDWYRQPEEKELEYTFQQITNYFEL